MPDHIDASFQCDACGAKLFWIDEHRDEAPVICPYCDNEGPTLGELKTATMRCTKKKVGKNIEQRGNASE